MVNDLLGLTLFGSSLAHLVLILGVTFGAPDPDLTPEPLPTLDITIVNNDSEREPEEAEFLAQANQDGGGERMESDRARSPLPAAAAPQTNPAPAAPPPSNIERIVVNPELLAAIDPAPEQIYQDEPENDRPLQTAPPNPIMPENPELREEKARLSAEISLFWEEYQKRPKRKFLSARTKEHKYAAYMEAWRIKVERIGNMNYPSRAREKKITGALVLDVALNQDGTLDAVTVERSSGHPLLDEAAINIVNLAAPFESFPESIASETDILHIIRTWEFGQGNRWAMQR